ncbi:LON peptidase substrate-binding domain-containing protein [Planctomycetota bacterium]|nr:LON peptidase substrate-binding domain-containing protein [Planctomycetota bacterium]
MPERSIDFNKPISLFPLGQCVLLPHTTVPLFVFEDRYRQMIHEALMDRQLIAMAVYADKDKQYKKGARPALREYVCVGYIVKHDQTYDGRYHVFLQGICRAKIASEPLHEPYRVAYLQPIEIEKTLEIDMQEERYGLEKLLHDPKLMGLASIGAINNWLSSEIPTDTLIDQTTLMTCNDTEMRYQMLQEKDIYTRAEWLTKYLKQTRKVIEVAEQFGMPESDDGYCLN